ncbi:MAG: hypothetical protein AAB906_02540 [Patescibacteria group bacterium]
MRPERWENIKGQIKDNFTVEEHDTEHLDEDGGIDVEYLIFNGPLGLMKLEFLTKPLVLDKITKFSHRAGSETKVEYVYSKEEKTHKFHAYKWDEGQEGWVMIDEKNFTL